MSSEQEAQTHKTEGETSTAGNPFESTQPARHYFVGRSKEIADLHGYLDTVKDGGATNLYILGGGGDGKTSLLYKIKEEAEKKGLVTTIITVSDGMEPDDVIYQLLDGALDEISRAYKRKEYYDDFQTGSKSTLFKTPGIRVKEKQVTPRDLQRDLEALLRAVREVGASGVVFCLDEGQRLKHISGGALFATIRAAIQAIGSGYMIVLASLEDIIPEIAEGYTGIDRFFPNTTPLGPFENDNIAIAAINKRLKGKNISFPHEVSEMIVKISERRPKNIIDISHDIYADATTANVQQVDLEMVRKVVYSRYANTVGSVLKTLGELRPNDQTTLRKILQLGGKATTKEVAKLYCQNNDEDCILRMEPMVYQELRNLVEKGLCLLDVSQREEVFYLVSGIVSYILESELGK